MTLSSPLFLSAFLPLCAAGLLLLGKTRFKGAWLLLCSCAFFALAADFSSRTWVLIPALALGAYYLPRLFRGGAAVYTALAVGVLFLLKLLGAAQPVGLSFVALQGICYALAAAKASGGRVGGLTDALLYTLFFPKLAAGPLCRVEPFLEESRRAGVSWASLLEGLPLLIFGLSKKLIIADHLLPLAQGGFAQGAHPLSCLLALIACPLYVYYDFSGYTDMARGAALVLGIRLPENFNRPFSARSIRDFWRRWHITLSSFLRDTVYIPLGGSRAGALRTARNLLAVFLLMGLWHGVTGPYILFGLWHGALMLLERFALPKREAWPRAVQRGLTLLAVALGFVLFLAPSVGAAAGVIKGLASWNLSFPAWQAARAALSPLSLLALGAGLALLFLPRIGERRRLTWPYFILLTALLLLCYAAALAGGYSPFLYAQF